MNLLVSYFLRIFPQEELKDPYLVRNFTNFWKKIQIMNETEEIMRNIPVWHFLTKFSQWKEKNNKVSQKFRTDFFWMNFRNTIISPKYVYKVSQKKIEIIQQEKSK